MMMLIARVAKAPVPDSSDADDLRRGPVSESLARHRDVGTLSAGSPNDRRDARPFDSAGVMRHRVIEISRDIPRAQQSRSRQTDSKRPPTPSVPLECSNQEIHQTGPKADNPPFRGWSPVGFLFDERRATVQICETRLARPTVSVGARHQERETRVRQASVGRSLVKSSVTRVAVSRGAVVDRDAAPSFGPRGRSPVVLQIYTRLQNNASQV